MTRINAERQNEDLLLKIGIHEGPCLAVTLNDRQDYFGQTVNMAARVQGLASSRAIFVTKSVVEDPKSAKILETLGIAADDATRGAARHCRQDDGLRNSLTAAVEHDMRTDTTRRRFVLTGLAATGIRRGICVRRGKPERDAGVRRSSDAAEMDGPFYKPKSPERADLIEPGAGGRPVELAGTVLTRSCKPVSRALVDLWHADDNGNYDQAGFRYRGHVFTGADGSFRFHTIMPALYPGRTRHYHVKVFTPGQRVLTTQLYFPDEPMNARDGLYRRELLMRMAQAQDSLSARFDFVLDLR